jgi:hypothetical protein
MNTRTPMIVPHGPVDRARSQDLLERADRAADRMNRSVRGLLDAMGSIRTLEEVEGVETALNEKHQKRGETDAR